MVAEGAEKQGRRCDEHAKGARSSVEQRESPNQVYAGPCRGGRVASIRWLARGASCVPALSRPSCAEPCFAFRMGFAQKACLELRSRSFSSFAPSLLPF